MARELVFLNIYLESLENHGNYQCLEDSLSLCPTKLQDVLMNLPKLNTWAVCLKVIPGARGMARLSLQTSHPQPLPAGAWELITVWWCPLSPTLPFLQLPVHLALQLPTL